MSQARIRSLFFLPSVACALALLALPAAADLVAKLPQVMDPFFITIADGRMYIVENDVSVHIFTLGPGGVSFVKTFGREGQGPGEFGFIYKVRPFKDHLDVHGLNKLARFSLGGDYQSEITFTFAVFKGAVSLLGDGYVAGNVNFTEKDVTTTLRLYDKDLKLVKEIGSHSSPEGLNRLNLVSDYYGGRVAGDTLYVVDARRDRPVSVTVYDRMGVEQKTVVLPMDPVKMTPALREAVIKPLKDDWSRSSQTPWSEFEKQLFFPDRAPGLDYFEVFEEKFLTRAWKYREDQVEFAAFDLEGRELWRKDLPFTGRLSNGILFCFYQGRYFYLRENPDEEVWELHSVKVW